MQVAIRVDASPRIGLGHFIRCLSLAEALAELGSNAMFVVRDLGLDVVWRLKSAGFNAICLPRPALQQLAPSSNYASWAGVTWQIDAQETIAALAPLAPTLVVVDHYSFDSRWHDCVAAELGAEVAAIDDIGDRPISAKVLIDHNLDAMDPLKYRDLTSVQTKLLMGPRFALLGRPYRQSKKYAFNAQVRSVGIFMGGVDADGWSVSALRGCREIGGFSGPVEVATTRANPHLSELCELADQMPSTEILLDSPDLAAFFSRHDVQIGAAGGASLERAALGVPSLLLVTAENQRSVAQSMVSQGAAAVLGQSVSLSEAAIGAAFKALADDVAGRLRISKIAPGLVDGRGALRVAAYLLRREVTMRLATINDADMTFRWRNHPSTRALSLDASPLTPVGHAAWMKNTLLDANRHLLVGHIGGLDVGVVRFDEKSPVSAEVSIYLDPELHRLELGQPMLRAAEAFFMSLKGGSMLFLATVLDANVASIRLFQSSGYSFSNGNWCKTVAAPVMYGVSQ